VIELHLGDCLKVLPTLDTSGVGAVITDPPYGIGINKSPRLSLSRGFDGDTWDKARLVEHVGYLVEEYPSVSMVVWGGNYYADILPPSRGWLIWDKLNDGRDFGEAELAWTNADRVIRRYKKFPIKMDGGKVHPTQKPIELMKWCIELSTKLGDIVLDPFMGIGSTGVACVMTGRSFIGIELQENYFSIAQKRIRQAQLQMRMPI